MFQDLFRHVEIDLPQNTTSQFMLSKNDKESTFFDTVAPGDDLKILWPTLVSVIEKHDLIVLMTKTD